MKTSEAIKNRRTVRAFLPEPIPEEELREILEIVQWAPSNTNTQPWHLALVSGGALARLRKDLLAHIEAGGKANPYFEPSSVPLEGVYKERQYDCANRYYGTMGIDRHDKPARLALMMKNWEFFGAPHVGFLSMPERFNQTNAADLGIYLQSLMLVLTERGYGSCAQGALAYYPEPIFEVADIPEGNRILCGISFGRPDPEAKINETRMIRADLAETVSFTS